ncbi:MAG: transposase [Nannocystaceae bacterium]|nr:transposase [Nannocystaceae bacterium]
MSRLHAGIIIVLQRFRSDLRLYVHLHYLVADGVFEEDAGDDANAIQRLPDGRVRLDRTGRKTA